MRDGYRLDEEDARAQPLEGFRWRKDTRLKWNRLWLLHYVSERIFNRSDYYASERPDVTINNNFYFLFMINKNS